MCLFDGSGKEKTAGTLEQKFKHRAGAKGSLGCAFAYCKDQEQGSLVFVCIYNPLGAMHLTERTAQSFNCTCPISSLFYMYN